MSSLSNSSCGSYGLLKVFLYRHFEIFHSWADLTYKAGMLLTPGGGLYLPSPHFWTPSSNVGLRTFNSNRVQCYLCAWVHLRKYNVANLSKTTRTRPFGRTRAQFRFLFVFFIPVFRQSCLCSKGGGLSSYFSILRDLLLLHYRRRGHFLPNSYCLILVEIGRSCDAILLSRLQLTQDLLDVVNKTRSP